MKTTIYKKQIAPVSSHAKSRSKVDAPSLKKNDAVQVNLTKVTQPVYNANRMSAYEPLVP